MVENNGGGRRTDLGNPPDMRGGGGKGPSSPNFTKTIKSSGRSNLHLKQWLDRGDAVGWRVSQLVGYTVGKCGGRKKAGSVQ